jgi:hypothetical protein
MRRGTAQARARTRDINLRLVMRGRAAVAQQFGDMQDDRSMQLI